MELPLDPTSLRELELALEPEKAHTGDEILAELAQEPQSLRMLEQEPETLADLAQELETLAELAPGRITWRSWRRSWRTCRTGGCPKEAARERAPVPVMDRPAQEFFC